jgi:hypothetical protein
MGTFNSITSRLSSGEKKKPVEKPVKRPAGSTGQDDFVKAVKSKGLQKAMKDALGITDEGEE